MYGNSDSFSIKIDVTKIDIMDIHDKTNEFLEKNKRGPIKKIYDDKNLIEVEHLVKRVRFGYQWRFTLTPMVIIHYSFKFTDNYIIIDSRIQYTPNAQPNVLIRIKPSNINWVLKNRDFIHGYICWIGFESDKLSRIIYPKSLLDEYNDGLKEGTKFFILIIHGLISVLSLPRMSISDLLIANIGALVADVVIWFSFWLQGREYRKIKNKYWS